MKQTRRNHHMHSVYVNDAVVSEGNAHGWHQLVSDTVIPLRAHVSVKRNPLNAYEMPLHCLPNCAEQTQGAFARPCFHIIIITNNFCYVILTFSLLFWVFE